MKNKRIRKLPSIISWTIKNKNEEERTKQKKTDCLNVILLKWAGVTIGHRANTITYFIHFYLLVFCSFFLLKIGCTQSLPAEIQRDDIIFMRNMMTTIDLEY